MSDEIRQAIRDEMKRRNMKCSELAMHVRRSYGVGTTSVHRLIKGGNSTLGTFQAVVDCLGLKIEVKDKETNDENVS